MSYQGTKNVAIYALSSGKFQDPKKIAGVKDLTNIMSAGLRLWLSAQDTPKSAIQAFAGFTTMQSLPAVLSTNV